MAELLTWPPEDTALKDRDCFLYQTPPSWLLEPEATFSDPQKAVRVGGCWERLATVSVCSDVVTDYHSFVSYPALGAGNEGSAYRQGGILLRSGYITLPSCCAFMAGRW